MAENIDGGALSFTSVIDNGQMNAAIDETMRRIHGLSDSMVASGDTMDATASQMLSAIRTMLTQIGDACGIHEQELNRLNAEYDALGKQMSDAFQAGRDDEVFAIREQQDALNGEIRMRKQLLTELREQSNVLQDEAEKLEASTRKNNENANAHVTLRQRIRDLREEMADMVANGVDEQSDAYKRLVAELGRLQDIQGDIQTQGRTLANDNAQFAGIMSGLQGAIGGFTALSSAVSLLTGENEDLQKAMLKVQQLMSITMALQQVASTLNKDSAFSLVTLANAREWWNNLLEVGRGQQIADTVATEASTAATAANAAAQTANATATAARTTAAGASTTATAANTVTTGANTATAAAGTVANIGLAGAFRMVGAAIKSIPVFGWIAAAIGALIAVNGRFTSKAREAKKAAEELYKSVAESAYKPVAAITDLQERWNALGDDFEAKQKFIADNKKQFDELGVAINGVTDAENLLSDPAQVQRYIDAQMKKAEAVVYMQQAQDKMKQLLESRQKEAAMSDTTSMYVASNSGMFGGTGSYVEVRNKKKDDLKAANDALEQEIKDGFKNAMNAEREGAAILNAAGVESAETYGTGTLGAIEAQISLKNEALKRLTNNDDYAAALAEIAALQAQADAITGKTTGGGGGTKKDKFAEKLDKYRNEYARFQKWVNSGDEILVKSANQEFASLLKEGATYIDYLKNQRDTILEVDVANRTKAQNRQLQQLNDAIAEETKQTVLESFNAELNSQLSNARTVIDMLNIIEQRRAELANDGTDLDNSKGEALDEAEKSALEKMQSETDSLLDEYASYTARKRQIDEQYNNDIALLNERRKNAQTDADREEIDAAIANRKRRYESESKTSGSDEYDAMLTEYATFEQKKQSIIDDFDEKRRIAAEMGNTELIERLNDAQAQALSSLASDELTGSEIWTNLFGNLDELTASQIDTLVREIEAKFDTLSGVFNPVDLANIRAKLEEAKSVLLQDNPFKQLGESIREIFNDAGDDSKTSADKIKKNWEKLGEATEASFNFVTDAIESCDFLKDAIGDVGVVAIESMQTCAATAITVATAIKTAEKSSVILAIIQAALVVVQAVVNVVKSIVGNEDAKLEKQIGKWSDAVDDLKNAYTQLSWEINKALGTDVYKMQRDAIANLQEQLDYLKKIRKAEDDKKKTDKDKMREYTENIADVERQIADLYDEIADDILQTTATDFAGTLGDALVEAFTKGTNAATAFEQTVNDVLKNAIVNQLKKQFLEQQLQSALDNLYNSMGYTDASGNFVFDGLTEDEIAAFREKVKQAGDNYNQALEIYKDIFSDLTDDSSTSLSGAVKGVTEETASILAGQMNAIRINQLESTNILRQSLQTLNTIAMNTQYNRYLVKIDRIIGILEGNANGLRSQGLSL